LIPAATAIGAASAMVTSGDRTASTGTVAISAVAPGLFSANSTGQGVAAAVSCKARMFRWFSRAEARR
jgi:uncharacterized protein (TIGR03437 family)